MDNVTHSLVGVLLGVGAARRVGSLRGAVWAGIVGSNLPDLDLALYPFYAEPRLGYLVHHRGHTHTLVAAPLLALVAWGWARWRAPEGRGLYALALLATVLHVVADGWNSYGIHPFWPVDPGWYYGDFVFIVEPWLWVALLPLAWTVAGRVVRGFLAGLGLACVGLVGVLVGWDLGLAVALALVLGQRLGHRGWAFGWAVGGVVATLSAFAAGSRVAAGLVRDAVPAGETLVDLARTPVPGHPGCWQVWVATVDGDLWRARHARVALFPRLRSPATCGLRDGPSTAPLAPPDLPDTPSLSWRPGFVAPVASFPGRDRCRASAFLHFGRIPYWSGPVVGDLRYDVEPGLGFAEVEAFVGDARGCASLPAWETPAAGILRP